jgi:DNA repair protein RecO (recombination protein O)
VAFDMDHGGALCRACRSGAPLGEDALELMRMILGGRLNDALSTPTSKATHEVMSHATRALEHHIERRLRSVALFETAGFERVATEPVQT